MRKLIESLIAEHTEFAQLALEDANRLCKERDEWKELAITTMQDRFTTEELAAMVPQLLTLLAKARSEK